MKKTNTVELTQLFNECRVQNQGKSYTHDEIHSVLSKLGFPQDIRAKLISKGYIHSEKIGTSKLYYFDKNPLHKNLVENLYNERRIQQRKYRTQPPRNEEERAVTLLQEKGYQIKRIVGFDEERFKKENPILYAKYLKYEIV